MNRHFDYLKVYTVPAPIKDTASIQKLLFDDMHYGAFHRKSPIFTTCMQLHKNQLNPTIQECPLLARIGCAQFSLYWQVTFISGSETHSPLIQAKYSQLDPKSSGQEASS